ncbi:hypothetical protein Acr_27g0010190 [Actinidia rufa]|uniref:Uncharacterized protein n=1 Tax=Actinidia rufa TaxID=165716 RepID=A0A7J0H850_9ERIC|nr:hypothetical protein Acr_27g0010190 [Actinidia rufa]
MREFDFTISSGSSGDRTDPNATLTPSSDLFFKGQLVPVEPSSTNESSAKPQFSLFKLATKFQGLILKLMKSKANVAKKTDPKHEETQNKPKDGSLCM